MARDREKARKYNKEYYDTHYKRSKEKDAANFDQYEYRSVGEEWRSVVDAKRDTYRTEINSQLVKDLMAGKTLLVDYHMDYGQRDHPFRTLYSYFNARGMRFRVYTVDDTKNENYRILLMWTEKLIVNYGEMRKVAKAA